LGQCIGSNAALQEEESEMADESLLLLANEVRSKTMRLLEGVDERTARFVPQGLSNTILWHAGHIYTVNELLGVTAATGQPPVMPDQWFESFSWKSTPAAVTKWPTLEEVVGKLTQQLRRLTAGIQGLSSAQLAAIQGDPERGRTVRYAITHGLHDEACHQGEIWLLKKMAGRK
jgi:hypothetical protein